MKVKLPKLMRGLDLRRQPRLPDLGQRELLVLEVLWEGGQATAHAVQNQMPDEGISLSTVQSTLERLYRKRLVDRVKEGRAYRYCATLDKSQLIAGLLRDMAEHVAAGDMAPMISGFLSYLSTDAPELLDGLPRSLGIDPPGDSDSQGRDE